MRILARWPQLLFLVAAALSLAPAWSAATLFSDRYDWRYFESMAEISRRAVLWYGEAPLWNPYSCGGEVGLANPQSLDAAPTFLLILLFGTALGYKLALCLYLFFAMDGTSRLGRRLGLAPQGAALAALGYGLSGYLAMHFSTGHMTFLGVALFPYLLFFYDRSLDEPEWAIPTGLIAAWIVALGGTFTPPMAAQLLILWGIMAALGRRSLRPLVLLLIAGAVALCAGAVRMLPVIEFIIDHPRPSFMRAADHSGPLQLASDLFAWRKYGPVPGRKYWAHEYTARLPYVHLPLIAATLLLVGLARSARRVALKLLVLAGMAALLSAGNFSPLSPWSLLQRLPVLRDLRVPSRHLVLLVLPLALLAGLGWSELCRRLAARGPRTRLAVQIAGGALIALAAVDGVLYAAMLFQPVFTVRLGLPEGPVPFHHEQGSWQTMRQVLFSGHGSLGCDEEAPLQRAEALDVGAIPQERLLDPSAGEITASRWSPSRRVVEVLLTGRTKLLVNSNWNEHWRADAGRIEKVAGRLAVDLSDLPPGRHVITLRYAPRSFHAGAVISLATLPIAGALFIRQRRRRGADGPR